MSINKIGTRIKNLRKEKKYTLKDISTKANISISFLSDIENGRSKPSIERLKQIADALDTTTSYLLNEESSSQNKKCAPNEKYPEVTEVKEAMDIIINQPGLMLNGEILDDEDKLILANSIQMGLRLAEEMRQQRKKQPNNK